MNIALVGDYSTEVPAHRAIPLALENARCECHMDVSWKWIATRELREPSSDFASASADAGLHFTAFDEAGAPRAAELLPGMHAFFIGTLFQPERAALGGLTPPLDRAFVQAAASFIL